MKCDVVLTMQGEKRVWGSDDEGRMGLGLHHEPSINRM